MAIMITVIYIDVQLQRKDPTRALVFTKLQ